MFQCVPDAVLVNRIGYVVGRGFYGIVGVAHRYSDTGMAKEGKKKSVSIAQVKEIIKLTLQELAGYSDAEIIRTVAQSIYMKPKRAKKTKA